MLTTSPEPGDPPRDEPRRVEARHMALELAEELGDILFALQVAPEMRYLYVSPSVLDLAGYSPEEHYADAAMAVSLLEEEDRQQLVEALSSDTDDVIAVTVRYRTRSGDLLWMDNRCRRVIHADGSIVVYGASRDVTDFRVAQERLVEERERYKLLAENSRDVVYRCDVAGLITWISPSVTAALGWQPQDLVGRPVSDFVHPDDFVHVSAQQQAIRAQGGDRGEAELRFRTALEGWRWMRVSGRVLLDEEDRPVGGIDELRDIQTEMETRALLQREVDHDALTGLAKRSLTLARLQEHIDARPPGGVVLLCAGVDGLTSVNQTYMHTAGDRVLADVADRLVRIAGASDRVGRVAGDEFAILLPDIRNAEDAAAAAEAVLAAVRGPVSIGPHEIDVSMCVGVAVSDSTDAEELLRDATTALRQAASRGNDRWEFLDTRLATAARARMAVQGRLREAIAQDGIRPWFQPIVTLADGRVCGYEALARWVLPDGTLADTEDFLTGAERSGVIIALDDSMLRHALMAAAEIDERLSMAVNVSAQTLEARDLAQRVARHLHDSGVAPERLHLEVTETSLLHVTREMTDVMLAVADLGVGWWVDDFGTGFSSVTHLRDLPVAGLKLDRSFTADLQTDEHRARQLALGLVGLAHGLDLDTVAEGVETRADADLLAGQGWAKGQGWLFGRARAELVP